MPGNYFAKRSKRGRKGRSQYRKRRGGVSSKIRSNLTYSGAKATSVTSVQRLLSNHTYNFTRMIDNDSQFTIRSNNVAFQGLAIDFRLNDVANVTEFTTLFDSYQICKVELHFVPDVGNSVMNMTDTSSANQYTLPSIYVHRDLDNAIAPTSEAQMTQRQDVKCYKATDEFKISIVPQVGREIFRTAVSTAYETPYKIIWLDANYADIPHYGIHVGITADGTTDANQSFSYKIKARYWLRFRTVI